MGRGWKNFEVHHRKILAFLKQTVGRNLDIQIPSGGNLKESKEHGRKSLYHLRKYIYHQKQNVARNVKVKGTDGEDSNKEHVIGNLRYVDICNIVA